MALGVGQLVIGQAVDGFVFADINIVRVVGNVQIGTVRHIGEVLVGGGGDHLHLAEFLGLGNRLFGPGAGFHIAAHAALEQIHGHHGKLQRAAALHKQNLIVVGNAHQFLQVVLGSGQNFLENLGPVAHLHDAHAAAAVVHHFGGDLLQNRFRHHSGAGGKIVGTSVLHHLILHVIHIIAFSNPDMPA
ncbi:hypothetical protein SDC9_143238 [bioreactor metagenome]|uniref:NAD-specific glutamate dehydrogenase n=1 Tax=bioreactor metagenome TaxID=1076179 RepID=A0A645E3E4_9ZZZZ